MQAAQDLLRRKIAIRDKPEKEPLPDKRVAPTLGDEPTLDEPQFEAEESDESETDVSYDAATKSLYYHLVLRDDDPAPFADARLDFGDKLKEATNLGGLSPTTSASAEIDPQNVTLDVTFGVLLEDGIPEPADRFFLQVRDNGPELQADANVSANIELAGRLGFLEIAVAGDGAENTANPSTASPTWARARRAKGRN